VESKQLEDLIKEVNQVLVDSINKDLQQYESEAELWNTEVQSKIADRLANKIDTVRENTLFFNNEDYWNQ
jgi:adenosyl cobinamide kinase/adenosyl cobinamide phosphate guanylyltransferase|tara:strand:+ start:2963 stop:3172 length:210 start_codon:yes stop_codon:yes gene_type:complete